MSVGAERWVVESAWGSHLFWNAQRGKWVASPWEATSYDDRDSALAVIDEWDMAPVVWASQISEVL